MPWDRSKYPKDWRERRARILERDGNCCKFCGVPNHAFIYRDRKGWHKISEMECEVLALEGIKTTLIVLTIAHLERGDKDCPDVLLAALCQRCHLLYDIKLHVSNAAQTRRLKKESLGQTSLLEAVA